MTSYDMTSYDMTSYDMTDTIWADIIIILSVRVHARGRPERESGENMQAAVA